MGTVFGFVSSDVSSKLDILGRLRCGQDGKCFETVGQMIVHEEKSKLLHDPKYVSGSRTLLRLHRALSTVDNPYSEIIARIYDT